MMADLISMAAAIEYLMTNMGWHDEDGYEVDDADEKRKVITDLVNGIPSVDAVPVVHGRWKEYHAKARGYGKVWYQHDCTPMLYESPYYYCPNCGAKMDSERRDDDALSGR